MAASRLNYVGYQARTDACGDWSEDLAFTADNQVSPNFGCSVQHNIAARSPIRAIWWRRAPMGRGRRRAPRRGLGNYEKGKTDRRDDQPPDQSGAVSDVAQVSRRLAWTKSSKRPGRGLRRRAA